MGTVNLLPVEPQGNKTQEEYLRYIANILAMFQDDLQNLLEGRLSANNILAESIETKNLKAGAITTDKIAAGAVTAETIAAGAVETDKLAAGAVTADKITVNELSAIAADLGTITAGSLTTNAHINVGTDATIGDNLYLNASNVGDKAIIFNSDTGGSAGRIASQSGDMSFTAGGFVTFTIGSSQGLVVNQKVTAPVLEATTAVTVNGAVVATEGYVNSGLAGKANGSGLNATIPPGSTLFVSNGVITGFM